MRSIKRYPRASSLSNQSRAVWVCCHFQEQSRYITAAHVLTEVSSDEAKNGFYSQFQEVLDTLPRKDLVLVAGDLNVHIGPNQREWEHVMSKFGIDEMNDNGLRLLSFAPANELVVGNSLLSPTNTPTYLASAEWERCVGLGLFRRQKSVQNITYERPEDERCRLRIRLSSCMYNTEVRFKRPCKKSTITSRRKWLKIANPATERRFEIISTNRFSALNEVNDAHEATETFAKVVNKSTREICATVHRWYSHGSLTKA